MTHLPWDAPNPRRARLDRDDEDHLVAVACDLADAARLAILPYFRARRLAHDDKGASDGRDWDPVTEADVAAEAAMREVLATLRPDDGIVGEEGDATGGTSGLTWVLDPIDGTRAFLAGLPTWGVLIAVFDGVEPVIGVIDQPYVDERWVGIATPDRRSCELRHGGESEQLEVRSPGDLSEAVLATTFPEVGTDAERRAFEAVRDRVMLTRYGGDCYAYALVASGTIDLVVEAGLSAWDVQALVPVVRGAGGMVTDWTGAPAHAGGQVLAAGDAGIHAEAAALLADTGR